MRFLLLFLISFLLLAATASAQPELIEIWEKQYPEEINFAKFSNDGQFIYGATDKNIVRISVETGEILSEFDNTDVSGIYDMNVSSIGNVIVTRDGGGGINIWDVKQEKATKYIYLNSRSVDISPDEQYIAVGSMLEGEKYNDGIIIIYDYINDKEITRVHSNSAVSKLKFSNDGRFLAAGSVSHDEKTSIRESILTLWETENWTKVKELQRVEGGLGYLHIKFSLNDEYIYFINFSTYNSYIISMMDYNLTYQSESDTKCKNIEILPDNFHFLVQYFSFQSADDLKLELRNFNGLLKTFDLGFGILESIDKNDKWFTYSSNMKLLRTNSFYKIDLVNSFNVYGLDDKINISYNDNILAINSTLYPSSTIQIYSLTGELIHSGDTEQPNSINIYLSRGIYFCVIRSGGKVYHQKFFVTG
jgi:dipeptidyl aminopeptidase/acylaminoacyl peptidase